MEMKDLLKQGITEALNKAIAAGTLPAGDYPDVALEVPPQKEFGDFASNIAMQSVRVAHKAPRIIAQAIVDGMDYPWLDHAEIAGAGFINFFLKNDVIYDTLKQILAAGDAYGHAPLRQEDTIQVEYVSANPTGPLHVGHGRGAAYGSALVNLLRAAGYNVQAEYYINDAGNQMNNLAASVNARYLELLGKPAEIPENGYHGHDIIETAQAIIDQDGDKYLDMPEAERLELFKDRAYAEKLKALKRDLAHFNVHYDNWFSERTLHPDAIQAACKVLEERGKIYEKDGALWLKSTDYGDDKDRVVIRDNGVPTYLAADIAYHKNKYDRGFKKMINIWGADHHGYVARVKAAMAALGYDVDQLEVLLLQMVSLFRDGKPVKMSKRTGQAITLNELIEEVGTDAARYFFIMRSLDTQLDFDLDLAKSHSNENPVYYIQYAHARIYSIYRQAKEAGANLSMDWSDVKWDTLTNEYELELIKKMAAFPEEVQRAARERAPHRIAHFVHELAGMFHTFYNHCRIIQEDKDLEKARLALVTAVRITIANSLAILGVSAPEKM
ncbi:arginine--tRNA ligase [Megasphaera elsdenii]|uniref:Arginine--tRNA ligase n=1 Tax=Megasphaera elsdenii DSM 20460 TaxID=1064535 RepID=G0VRD7_MEGEL|nr:arginine--tRNA ligase [Megasphaera elsdenii]AVO73845.1 arginine--tRNA ligase [Megasphaera elsdenii DSM 20460]CCC72382.1 arginyl-tRNA synthetase [Megasphaera elsdenii DSM 20460]